MKPRFLFDEDTRWLLAAVRRHYHTIDVVGVGDLEGPLLGTKDPFLLLYCEQEQRLLVTGDRSTMPRHIADHLAAGHLHWGVFYLRPGRGHGEYADALDLAWEASDADEWVNREVYIPF